MSFLIDNCLQCGAPMHQGVWAAQRATPAAPAPRGSDSAKSTSSIFDEPAAIVSLGNDKPGAEVSPTYSREQVTGALQNPLTRLACPPSGAPGNGAGLDPAEQEMVRELQARDREVKAHEQAHAATLGPYARGIQYSYQLGPDGRMYAVGGSVTVDASSGGTPAAAAAKARILRRAALAGGEASPADMAAAASAGRMEANALNRMTA